MINREDNKNSRIQVPGNQRDTPELESAATSKAQKLALTFFAKPESYAHFPEKIRKEIVRNLGFVDAGDLVQAFEFSKANYPEAVHPALNAHTYYLKPPYGCGRFPEKAFENYRSARAYVEKRAATGAFLEPETLFRINALILTGNIYNEDKMLRGIQSPMMVRRDKWEISSVFGISDGKCTYKTSAPPPPIRGFFSGEVVEMERPPGTNQGLHLTSQGLKLLIKKERETGEGIPNLPKVIADYPLIALLQGLSVTHGCSSVTQKTIDKEISSRLYASPSEVPGETCAIIFHNNPLILRKHLDDVLNYCKLRSLQIAQSEKLLPGSSEYVSVVCYLAAKVARVVDMAHFSRDGMGRTSLLVERYILRHFGIEPPVYVVDYDRDRGRHYENGTYREESHRAAKLFSAIKREGKVSEKLCKEAVRKMLKLLDAKDG